ncbi:methyltransferase [bacterium]|nr:methyltransferase [bacterium]
MEFSVFLLGVLAMIAQAAFLREVLATFRGGELTIGTALLFWLFWTAVGSGIMSRFASRTGSPERRFHSLLPWYGVMGYLGVTVIADIPFLARLTPGELVPFDLQVIALGLAFLPFNVIGGMLFTLGVQTLEQKNNPFAGKAFTIEAFGSAVAGAVISIMFVVIFSNHLLALICPAVACAGAVAWSVRTRRFVSIIGLVLPMIVLIAMVWENSRASDYMYTGQKLLRSIDTKYGRLRVTERGEIKTFYSDASVLFSAPDEETAEYTVHIPMLAAPKHGHVLILGGGPGGLADEVLKYGTVDKVTCVELDPYLFKLADIYLRENWRTDPRIETIFMDGRAFLERTHTTFDVIIMNMPPPLSGLTNRYFTREFFRLTASRLPENGVLGFSFPGAENYVPDDLARLLASMRATLRTSFTSVTILPGITCRFLASNSAGLLDNLGWENLAQRREALGVETAYVRDYFLRYTLSRERMDSFNKTLDSVPDPFINSDARPAGYFTLTTIQGKLERSRIMRPVEPLETRGILFAVMVLGLAAAAGAALFPGKGAYRRSIMATVASVGLTEISLEVLAIMAYQSIFGFLYGRIALLTGSYMAGLAYGALIGSRKVENGQAGKKNLVIIQSVMALLPLIWIILLRFHTDSSASSLMAEIMFYIITALAGFIGGLQFPVADSLFRKSGTSKYPGRGIIYSVDLAGSSIGALVTASLMIPILGMTAVLVFLAVLNCTTAGALLIRSSYQ